MSASMARQAGWVKYKQSDMRLVLNTATIAKAELSCTTRETKHNLIIKPNPEVQEKEKQGAEFPGYRQLKDAVEKHSAMAHEN